MIVDHMHYFNGRPIIWIEQISYLTMEQTMHLRNLL